MWPQISLPVQERHKSAEAAGDNHLASLQPFIRFLLVDRFCVSVAVASASAAQPDQGHDCGPAEVL